jgi:hypothetical protein
MCTNSLPFKDKNEILNKPTPKLPDEFKDYNNLLER